MRALPFTAAFAFGLLVASFFVDISPRSGYREHRNCRYQEMRSIRMERDELRQENLRLKNQLNMNWDDPVLEDGLPMDLDVSKPVAPPPPPPPHRIRR
jgi:hypothetical protein